MGITLYGQTAGKFLHVGEFEQINVSILVITTEMP